MCSVFIPAAFLPGTTGQLYKQFAITIVISVSVSGFVALTLTPAMCALHAEAQPAADSAASSPGSTARSTGVTRGFGHAVEFVIKRMVIALVLLAVFLYSIYHLFNVLPTSFVPQRGPGLRDGGDHHAAGREPRPHAGDRRARSTRSSRRSPASQTRTMITGYSLLDSGFKTNAGDVLRHVQGFRGALRDRSTPRRSRTRARSCRASSREAQQIEEAIVHPDRAAGDSRHRHDRRLRVLDPGHRHRRPGRARRRDAGFPARRRASGPSSPALATTYSRHHAAAARQRRPRQDDAARHPDPGRLQRDPGAVRLADGEPVQPVQPRVVGDRAVRCAVPAEPGGPDAPLHAHRTRTRWCRCRRS